MKAARQYQTAVSVYKAARETVALAERRLTENSGSTAAQLTSAWQEMLNHAISKVKKNNPFSVGIFYCIVKFKQTRFPESQTNLTNKMIMIHYRSSSTYI